MKKGYSSFPEVQAKTGKIKKKEKKLATFALEYTDVIFKQLSFSSIQ